MKRIRKLLKLFRFRARRSKQQRSKSSQMDNKELNSENIQNNEIFILKFLRAKASKLPAAMEFLVVSFFIHLLLGKYFSFLLQVNCTLGNVGTGHNFSITFALPLFLPLYCCAGDFVMLIRSGHIFSSRVSECNDKKTKKHQTRIWILCPTFQQNNSSTVAAA